MSLGKRDEETTFTFHERLLTRDEVRADELQMFVSRLEEDLMVASFHLPVVRGKARQIKFIVPIIHHLRSDAKVADSANPLDDGPIVTQAIVDLEQICVNFVSAALPVLRKCAYRFASLNPSTLATPQAEGAPQSDNDGCEEFIVDVSNGWPLTRPRYRCHDVVRLDPKTARRDVDAGYLVPAASVDSPASHYGQEYRDALAAYRERRAREMQAAPQRPAPTDAAMLLATSEGRKIRRELTKEFAEIAGRLFPPSPGRPPARTEEENAALVAELQKDFNKRKARYVARGVRKTRQAILDEMAAEGRYGSGHQTYSAANIEKLLKGSKRRKQ